jgi:stress-induced morphogen
MRLEILRFWEQAQEDLETARYNSAGGKFYAAAFFCQQAVENEGATAFYPFPCGAWAPRGCHDHLRTSDVDLIIVSPDFEGIPFLRRIREVVQFWDSDLALEVLPYTPEEFMRKAQEIGIVSQAIREGLEV